MSSGTERHRQAPLYAYNPKNRQPPLDSLPAWQGRDPAVLQRASTRRRLWLVGGALLAGLAAGGLLLYLSRLP